MAATFPSTARAVASRVSPPSASARASRRCESRTSYLGSTLLELARRGRRRAIVGVCTAGGMATAAYLERA